MSITLCFPDMASALEVTSIAEWTKRTDFKEFSLKYPDAQGFGFELVALLDQNRAKILGWLPHERPAWTANLKTCSFNMYDYPHGHEGPMYIADGDGNKYQLV